MNLQNIRRASTQICVLMGEKRDKVQFISLMEFLYPNKGDMYM